MFSPSLHAHLRRIVDIVWRDAVVEHELVVVFGGNLLTRKPGGPTAAGDYVYMAIAVPLRSKMLTLWRPCAVGGLPVIRFACSYCTSHHNPSRRPIL